MTPVRCAIYTRKSSEEGLEQDFNSLHAQREACTAYVLSQAGEGWTALAGCYDDGGISGGTLERPGLQRLLGDVKAGLIDIIVVYKVDRLTRSLLDFAKLVEAFDAAGVSFVSVTQSFNTTTSMGRLTLNMLLSFAQFEREVTAERIRDKIAASKARGMWMGGIPPLGYRPEGRSLAIVPEQAALVDSIYRRYLGIGNVRLLAKALREEGVTAPIRTTTTGKSMGGQPFSRGQLYLMLACRTYLGEISHHGKVHPGLHEAIIDRDLWERVRTLLEQNRQGRRIGRNVQQASLLAGLVRDETGEPLIPVHATKGKVRYRYYVSRALQTGEGSEGMRIPARELETAVVERLAQAFDNPIDLMAQTGARLGRHDISRIIDAAEGSAARIRQRKREVLLTQVEAVEVMREGVILRCRGSAVLEALGLHGDDQAGDIIMHSPVRLTRSGRALRLVQDGGATASARIDPSLVGMIAKAHYWWRILRTDPVDIKTLAARERVSASWMTRVLRLAFLSPVVTEAILTGRQKADVDAAMLLARGVVNAAWDAQGARFLVQSG